MTQISLISEQWIPVRDRKGVVRKISPLEILDEEIVDIAAERADFQTALWQFLIGLIQTTLAPEDEGVPRVSGDEPGLLLQKEFLAREFPA